MNQPEEIISDTVKTALMICRKGYGASTFKSLNPALHNALCDGPHLDYKKFKLIKITNGTNT